MNNQKNQNNVENIIKNTVKSNQNTVKNNQNNQIYDLIVEKSFERKTYHESKSETVSEGW